MEPRQALTGTNSPAPEEPSVAEFVSKQIFICYARVGAADVAKFHTALLDRLRLRGRTYQIFRDVGPEATARIETGDDWKAKIDRALAESICCLVVLLPAVLESAECEREFVLFQRMMEDNPRRFIYPVEFIPRPTPSSNGTATAKEIAKLWSQRQFFSFSSFLLADEVAYRTAVDKIASELDRRVNAGRSTNALTAEKVFDARAAEVTVKPTAVSRRTFAILLSLTAGAAVAAFVVYSGLFAVQNRSSTPVTEPISLALPLKALSEPRLNASPAPDIDAGVIKPGQPPFDAINLVTIDGAQWYEFVLANGDKRYVPKDSVPVWIPLPPNIELIKTIEARSKPLSSEPAQYKLEPGDIGYGRAYGIPTRATIDMIVWYQIRQRGRAVFFAEQDAKDALVTWMPLPGCLKAMVNGEPKSQIFNGISHESFYANQMLGYEVQSATIGGTQWYRFQRHPGDVYSYVSAGQVQYLLSNSCPR